MSSTLRREASSAEITSDSNKPTAIVGSNTSHKTRNPKKNTSPGNFQTSILFLQVAHNIGVDLVSSGRVSKNSKPIKGRGAVIKTEPRNDLSRLPHKPLFENFSLDPVFNGVDFYSMPTGFHYV
jgi:hypothetical protein